MIKKIQEISNTIQDSVLYAKLKKSVQWTMFMAKYYSIQHLNCYKLIWLVKCQCGYMTSALVADTEKMNIVQMVLAVTRLFALVYDLEQHSCNMTDSWFIEFHYARPIKLKLLLD
jgi:hypothetical protein